MHGGDLRSATKVGAVDGGDILIVDDTPENLKVLADLLKRNGHKVRPAPDGVVALRAAERKPPDLVLLDISMPHMNGYEVCERLKSMPALADVPVLFISGLSEPIDKVRAFRAGGVDFVTKPFEAEELLARVNTHLRLHRLHRELAGSYARLQQLEALRESLTNMIVHDMRSPLAALSTSLHLMKEDLASTIPAESLGDIDAAIDGAERLIQMVNDLLDISRLEAGEMPLDRRRSDLRTVVDAALVSLARLTSHLNVQLDMPDDAAFAHLDPPVIQRTLENLIANAAKFTPRGGSVTIAVEHGDDEVRVSVLDEGPGIPAEYHLKIFEKFGQVESRKEGRLHSSGLGLAFCRLAVEAHGGTIGVDSEPGRGSRFWISLPANEDAASG